MADAGPAAVRTVELILDDQLARRPQWATELGDHRGDARLDDWSPDAVRDRRAAARDQRATLAALDLAPLPPELAVDVAILGDQLDASVFALGDLREHEWNPMVHLPGEALHALLARPYAPLGDRLGAFVGRLTALPDALATARAVLGPMPAIHAGTARDQAAGVAAMITRDTEAALGTVPGLRDVVTAAREPAIAALAGFGQFLTARLDAGADRDPRLGAELWNRKLGHSLGGELTGPEVLAAAHAHLAELTEQLTETAYAYLGEARRGGDARADRGRVRAALVRVAVDAPTDGTIVDDAGVALAEATAFVAAAELVMPVDDAIEIIEMPEFARGVAVAYCDPPGPLESAPLPTFFAIAPTPDDWSADRRASFYREYNRAALRNLSVHEAMPGHHLQLAVARRFAGPTRVRAAIWSGTFVEGWACYAEQFMAEAGFGGLPVRLQQLKMQLRMTINAVLDHGVHAGGMESHEAMALMTGPGLQEEGEAVGKWRRALLTSGQLSTYFVGWSELRALRTARHPSATGLRAFHDELLAHGSPPPRHLRTLLDAPPA